MAMHNRDDCWRAVGVSEDELGLGPEGNEFDVN